MQGDSSHIANRIRALRTAKGLKQSALDDIAQLPGTSICKIEIGKREPTASELVRIARALGTSLDGLVNGETNFAYNEEIKIIEALREISFEDYQRILRMLEACVYYQSKDSDTPLKDHLLELVSALTTLSEADNRPRSKFQEKKRIRNNVRGSYGSTKSNEAR